MKQQLGIIIKRGHFLRSNVISPPGYLFDSEGSPEGASSIGAIPSNHQLMPKQQLCIDQKINSKTKRLNNTPYA